MTRAGAVLLALGLVAADGAAQSFGDDPTPYSDVRLVSEVSSVQPGEPFTVGIHITLDDGWHTYWKNAGDSGNGVLANWLLPEGFEADSLQYPIPERIPYPPLMSYGFHDEVVLLARVTPPTDISGSVNVAVAPDYLVCADICVPAMDTVSVTLPVRNQEPSLSRDAGLIADTRELLPLETDAWTLRAARTDTGFVLAARPPEEWSGSLAGAYFYPEDGTILSHTESQPAGMADGELRLELEDSEYILSEPDRLTGILVLPTGAAFNEAGRRSLAVDASVETNVAWASDLGTPLVAQAPPRAGAGSLSLVVALFFAFVGGLILNLMPCVFPILSLKALGFATRGGDRAGMRRDGLAFGAGVVLTFLAVAGVLMAVRAGGAEVGWGYQLQSPTMVALLAALMFGLGLWLAGVIELGASLTRLGGMGGDGEGVQSAFLTGVLATVVATPCTAPFMGAAIGAAMLRPAIEALAVFAGLGVGMATPYVILSFWPAMAERLPRPGRWMETFKQVLSFPMFAVAVWLIWVFGLQVGIDGATQLLFGLLLLALAAWLVGRWPAMSSTPRVRWVTRGLAILALLLAGGAGVGAVRSAQPLEVAEGDVPPLEWEAFSAEAVQAHRQAGHPVFVDFTAAWCISCQVNERVALQARSVRSAFHDYGVVMIKADWTRRDPVITRALSEFGRVGVPLYILYPADPAAEPRLLPELLTPSIVLDALQEELGEPGQQQAYSRKPE